MFAINRFFVTTENSERMHLKNNKGVSFVLRWKGSQMERGMTSQKVVNLYISLQQRSIL